MSRHAPGLEIVKEYQAPQSGRRLRLLDEDELEDLPEQDWLVQGVIPEESNIALIALRGSFKTFVAVDLACCISTGTAWQGRQVRQGRAIYIAGEGGRSIKRRLNAWKAAHNLSRHNVLVLPHAVSLLVAGNADALIAAIEERTSEEDYVALIVVDTVHKCIPGGEENSNDTFSLMYEVADVVRRRTGCTFLFLHHPPKDGRKTGRGGGSFEDDADTSIHLEREGDAHSVQVRCEKQRDDEEFPEFTLSLRPLAGSLVVAEAGDWRVPDMTALTPADRKVLNALDQHREESVSYTRLLKLAELSETSLSRSLKHLYEQGHIERHEAGSHAGRPRFAYQILGKGIAALLPGATS